MKESTTALRGQMRKDIRATAALPHDGYLSRVSTSHRAGATRLEGMWLDLRDTC